MSGNGNDSDTRALSSAFEEHPSQGARGFDSRLVHWTSEPTGSGAVAAEDANQPPLPGIEPGSEATSCLQDERPTTAPQPTLIVSVGSLYLGYLI